MKTWLRWLLIVYSVGGGFTGFVVTLEALFRNETGSGVWLIYGLVMLLYAFVVVSGLRFADNPKCTLPLMAASIIQTPWVSSPIIVYRFCAGFGISAGLLDGKMVLNWRFGSYFEIFFFGGSHPWGAGIDLFSLLVLILLLKCSRRPNTTPGADIIPS